MKRTVLFVVDALSEDIVSEWIGNAKLPSIQTMLRLGGKLRPCTSIFPSITPAATCSIATGHYPAGHGIEGACWYDADNNDSAYFGDDIKLAMQEGLHEYLVDFGDRMNYERLQVPLVYEHFHQHGTESACINYMWFRGPHVHSRSTPLTLRLVAGGLVTDVRGPKFLKLGDFVHSLPDDAKDVAGMQTGLLNRYGFNDETTAAVMMSLAKSDSLPAFSLAYFPLNDDVGHSDGLHHAASVCVEAFDEFLGEFVEAIGGWELVGSEYSFLIVGDHSQTEWIDKTPRQVELDKVFEDFKRADTAAGFVDDDELLIGPNMRAAAVYLSKHCKRSLDEIAQLAIEHDGIDQAIHRQRDEHDGNAWTIRTKDRGRLTFYRANESDADSPEVVRDRYGNFWKVRGDLAALDLTRGPDGELIDGNYPNPLERIEGAFPSGSSPVWLTAQPDSEFVIVESSSHGAGSHGSLNLADSKAALLTSRDINTDQLPAPESPRIVDVMDLCLASLGAKRIETKAKDPMFTPDGADSAVELATE
tara:strand:- start:95499 stop:97091 length:1593 start_codon:yes stop_codon:yes gene_type:complete